MIKISIIVPIYNVEKYLKKCLESLFSQTLKEIEIIAINDGSTDNSYEIAKKYQDKENFKLLTQENKGLSYTRNLGLKSAKGKYIMFVDSDDYLDKDVCERLYEFALEKDADITCYDLKYLYPDMVSIMPGGTNEKVTQKEYVLGSGSAANKMYKKSFLNKINFKFEVNFWSEDAAIIPSLCLYTDKIYYLKDCYYNYFQRQNSITNQTTFNPKSFDTFKAVNILVDKFKTNNKYEEYIEEIEFIYVINLLLNIPLKVYKFKEAKSKLKELTLFMKENYPNWRKNKYFKELSFKQKIYCTLFYYNKASLVKFLYDFKHLIKGDIKK